MQNKVKGVLILFRRKHKLPITLLIICLIGLTGFKDTGIFVKDYVSLKDDGIPVEFGKEEVVNVLRETEESYIVKKDDIIFEIPMDTMIRTTRTTQKYIVKKETNLLDSPLGNPIRTLAIGEIVQALNFERDYGVFNVDNGVDGYIHLDDLDVIITENISYGTSKVDKVLKNNKSYYTLVKGEIVSIKDFNENIYTIVDDKGNEFKAKENFIELRKTRERATRTTNVSRRSTNVNKVIEAAYGALGKPYISAGIGPKGYDCSGLTYSIYLNHLGIKLNRTSRDQAKNGVEVKKADLIPGDLVFFRTSGRNIGHVGLYIGDNEMIHASSGRRKIMISSLDEAYYKQRYVTARRIIK